MRLLKKVWKYYSSPEHIVHWNFADPSWHCPTAENDMQVGGKYRARMEARDASIGFNLMLFIIQYFLKDFSLTP